MINVGSFRPTLKLVERILVEEIDVGEQTPQRAFAMLSADPGSALGVVLFECIEYLPMLNIGVVNLAEEICFEFECKARSSRAN